MMDFETFHEFQDLAVTGIDTTVTELANLTHDEHQLFTHLLDIRERNRLEQEKIPHSYALKKIVGTLKEKT
jgi:hypothetical protein